MLCKKKNFLNNVVKILEPFVHPSKSGVVMRRKRFFAHLSASTTPEPAGHIVPNRSLNCSNQQGNSPKCKHNTLPLIPPLLALRVSKGWARRLREELSSGAQGRGHTDETHQALALWLWIPTSSRESPSPREDLKNNCNDDNRADPGAVLFNAQSREHFRRKTAVKAGNRSYTKELRASSC